MKGVIDRYKSAAKEEPPGSNTLEVNKVHCPLLNHKNPSSEIDCTGVALFNHYTHKITQIAKVNQKTSSFEIELHKF
jgi:hypothetical protein